MITKEVIEMVRAGLETQQVDVETSGMDMEIKEYQRDDIVESEVGLMLEIDEQIFKISIEEQ